MAPERRIQSDLSVPSVPSLFLEYEAELAAQSLSERVAKSVEHMNIQWVDLHPTLQPAPKPLPLGSVVKEIESKVSPDKSLPTLFIMGSCEFAGNNLDPFVNEDGSLISIAPHVVSRYVMGGPISPDLYGPVTGDFINLVNMSYVGQSWKEVAVFDVDTYVSAWCKAKPQVTILGLGLWDVVMGECGWTPQCAKPANYSDYYLRHLCLFKDRAREFCRKNYIDYEAWISSHTFVCLSLPNWFQLTPELETPYTISPAAWTRFRKVCFRDMYPIQTHLWEKHSAFFFHPDLPAKLIRTRGDCYLLGPKFNRLYLAQILAVVAKIVCIRPTCRVPNDFALMRWHLLASPAQGAGKCGRYWARFISKGQTLIDMWSNGHC